ncbi:hypothetical protein T492DRAFT_834143 [Pavlovales sp. CCMP2436]|nr:hypothetical protein T492DRAFT_834143 [Pavlovales sp. CCMP2436]
MAGFLPAELADAFRTFVMGFVCMPYTHAVKEANALAALRDGGKSEMEEGDGEETDADARVIQSGWAKGVRWKRCKLKNRTLVISIVVLIFCDLFGYIGRHSARWGKEVERDRTLMRSLNASRCAGL